MSEPPPPNNLDKRDRQRAVRIITRYKAHCSKKGSKARQKSVPVTWGMDKPCRSGLDRMNIAQQHDVEEKKTAR